MILNQCTFHEDFKDFQRAQIDTWVEFWSNDFTIINYYGAYDGSGLLYPGLQKPPSGGSIEYEQFGVTYLIVDSPDVIGSYDPRGVKQFMAFEHVADNYEFDYLYRTGTTTYCRPDLLTETLKSFPLDRVYSGSFSGSYTKDGVHFHFVMGADMIMSRDVFDLFMTHKDRYLDLTTRVGGPESNFEDICVGRILNHDLGLDYLRIENQPIPPYSVNYKDPDCEVKVLENHHCYRFHYDCSDKLVYLHNLINS